ncbi:MAG: TlpA disulfide reductase family protein [Bacteroidales bacterium]|nr:TlpA disulfide reductase family protein [Bacteroidales bacterium]
MRKFAILTGLLCLLFACNRSKSHEGILTASLTNIPDGTVLNFVDIDSGKTFRKIKVFDNKFEIKFNFPTPREIGIWEDKPKYDKYRLLLWLENSKINISGNYDYFVNAKVEGSASNIIHQQFVSFVRKFDNSLSDLKRSRAMTNNQFVKDSISKEIEQVLTQYKDEKIQLYQKYIESEVAFYNLASEITNFNSVLSKSDIEKPYNELPDKFKSDKKGELLKEFISLPEIPKVGEKFVDCSQLTPDGKTESISSNLGKYTIVEFWASGCGPCRAKHSELRKIYNLYHKKGLNIISISGDNDSDDWENAIKKDSLIWTNISDLKGWNNKAFMIYGIKFIPQMILLDENGFIVDNKSCGVQYLEEYFLKKKLK